MLWGETAALLTAVCWALTAVFFSYSGRRVGADLINRSRLLFAFVFLLITHRVLEGQFFPTGVEPFRWGWLALSSLLGLVLGDAFLFRAYALIGPHLSMLMMSTVPIISALAGWLLFGETVTLVEFAGMLLAVVGVAWVVTEVRSGPAIADRAGHNKGLLFGLLGAAGQVANLVTARYALVDDFSAISATVIRILIAFLVLWGLAIVRGQIRETIDAWRDKRIFQAIIAGSVAGPFLGIWLSLIAVQNARLGIASTLMALPPILLIPMEHFVFKRKVSRRGVTGTIVALVGVAILFL